MTEADLRHLAAVELGRAALAAKEAAPPPPPPTFEDVVFANYTAAKAAEAERQAAAPSWQQPAKLIPRPGHEWRR